VTISVIVTTGLDPVVHADLPAAWIAGSSPAMTAECDSKDHYRDRLAPSGHFLAVL
jgi:hypothetical protein